MCSACMLSMKSELVSCVNMSGIVVGEWYKQQLMSSTEHIVEYRGHKNADSGTQVQPFALWPCSTSHLQCGV